jgi:hypothetical protein
MVPPTAVSATTHPDNTPGAPVNLIATAADGPLRINLTWSSGGGTVAYYVIERSSNNSSYVSVGTATTPNYTDSSSLSSDVTYLYRVRAAASGGTQSAPSNFDPATTVFFVDPALDLNTRVKEVHFTQLRTAVNAMRASAGLSPATWADPVLNNTVPIRALHILQLRDRLGEALSALNLSPPNYEDPVITIGSTPVKKRHVEQLRERVQ